MVSNIGTKRKKKLASVPLVLSYSARAWNGLPTRPFTSLFGLDVIFEFQKDESGYPVVNEFTLRIGFLLVLTPVLCYKAFLYG